MKIIKVDKKDLNYMEQIIELEKESLGENGAIDYWNLKPLVKYGAVYALIEKDEVIACVELIKNWEDSLVYLYGIAVKKSMIGRGYGTEILKHVLKILSFEKIEAVELTVDPQNFFAIKFYEKFEFVQKEFVKNEYGTGIDRIVYKKILG